MEFVGVLGGDTHSEFVHEVPAVFNPTLDQHSPIGFEW